MTRKQKNIKSFKVLILFLLTFNISASGYFSISDLSPNDCCKVEVLKSCCMMNEMANVEKSCEMNSTAIKNYCGCYHSSNSTSTTSYIKTNIELPKLIVVAQISFENKTSYNSGAINSVTAAKAYESPPIYLIDSSFLI